MTGIPGSNGPAEPYEMSGQVRDKNGKSMPDKIVRLFGRHVLSGREKVLAQVKTDSDGRFFIQYEQGEFEANADDTNRLIILVFNNTNSNQSIGSTPLFRPPRRDEPFLINLTVESPVADPKDLETCRNQLAETRQALAIAEQDRAMLRDKLQEREQSIRNQQSLIADLQKRITGLEEIIREVGEREAIEPTRLGTALGEAVDAIQQGLTNLPNRFVDYGLQELDLNTQVNLQVSRDGRLLIRFPGLNEQVASHNLSQLQMRLRPIPKTQKAPDQTPETDGLS